MMLQRVEADLKEVVQGPVDVTGRREGVKRLQGCLHLELELWHLGDRDRDREACAIMGMW